MIRLKDQTLSLNFFKTWANLCRVESSSILRSTRISPSEVVPVFLFI